MAITQPKDEYKLEIQHLVMSEIENSLVKEWEAVKTKFIEDLDRRKAEIISSCALYVMERAEIMNDGRHITIRLETKKV